MRNKAIDQNPYRQWLEGDRISKKPSDMTSEELVKFTSSGAIIIIQRIKTLAPYFRELRKRFHGLKRGETIAGYRNWAEFCSRHLGRTKRTLNYMLAGGNKYRPQLRAPDDDAGGLRQRTAKVWEDVETVLQLLAEANRILALPITEAMTKELQNIIRSAVQVLTEAMTKLGAERDT